MESFDLTQLKKGEELLVTTESGSIYHLFAETAPESLGRGKHLIRGLRATRDSDHPISGDPELIENEPAVVQPFSSGGPGILEAGLACKYCGTVTTQRVETGTCNSDPCSSH